MRKLIISIILAGAFFLSGANISNASEVENQSSDEVELNITGFTPISEMDEEDMNCPKFEGLLRSNPLLRGRSIPEFWYDLNKHGSYSFGAYGESPGTLYTNRWFSGRKRYTGEVTDMFNSNLQVIIRHKTSLRVLKTFFVNGGKKTFELKMTDVSSGFFLEFYNSSSKLSFSGKINAG